MDMRALIHALGAAALLGVVSTFGDFVWDNWQVRHRMTYGLIHGAVICLCIGAVIGARSGKVATGAAAGPLVGLLAAGSFYLLASTLGYSAMFPAWMLFWLCFGLLQARLSGDRGFGPAIARGLLAAVLSGLAFYMVSGMWTRPPRGGPDYPRFLLNWTFAFFPGFLVLFWATNPRGLGARDGYVTTRPGASAS
jgi:hypothetical protein